MRNMALSMWILLLLASSLVNADGTKGASGNQWPQNPTQQRFPQSKGQPLGGWDDEVSNPRRGGGGGYPEDNLGWKLEDSVPGVPGQSYPNLQKIPETSFDCRKQMGPGYYGDIETKCQVFHICQADGRQNSFLCPTGTIFNQQTFVCDWWFNVNCAETSIHINRNDNLYKSPYIGIDGMKTSSYKRQRNQGPNVNSQQPAVGIPKIDSQPKGQNWPSQVQGQAQGQWQQGGNQKGNRRPSGQRGMIGGQNLQNRNAGHMKGGTRFQNPGMSNGQNWQNRNTANMKGNAGGVSPGRSQKGSRRAQLLNMDWQQQGIHPGGQQKGGNIQQRPLVNNNPNMNQRGDMHQGFQNNKGQFGHPGGIAGGVMQQRRPNAQGGFNQKGDNRPINNRMGPNAGMHQDKGQFGHPGGITGDVMQQRRPDVQGDFNQKGDRRPMNSRMGPNTGMHQDKGFNANNWSLRPQNFQSSSQDRKGSGSDVWLSNHNADIDPNVGNYLSSPNQWQGQSEGYKDHDPNSKHFESIGGNTGWNTEDQKFAQWNGNVADGNIYNQYDGSENSHGIESSQEWKSDANINKEDSWQVNNQWTRDQVGNDYDYN